MKLTILDSASAQSALIAEHIASFIRDNPGALLCLAAGNTPLPVYAELVRLQNDGQVDLNSVYYVGLDEWLGVGLETAGSCQHVMFNHFYLPAGIAPDHRVVWNGLAENPEEEIRRITDFIHLHGGIDMTLLGIGMNGHVGFNEPGCDLFAEAFCTPLSESTQGVSMKYFDSPLVLKTGLGIGIRVLKAARQVLIMASGKNKATIVSHVLSDAATNQLPASLLRDHPCATLYLDQEAAAMLEAAN